jgi:hypothetical protein
MVNLASLKILYLEAKPSPMNEDTKPQATLGNEHLSKLITVLLEQNDVLKKENDWLRIQIGLSTQDLPDAQMSNTENMVGMPDKQMQVGQDNVSLPHTNLGVGLSDVRKSDMQSSMGQTNFWKPYLQNHIGQTEVGKPHAQTEIGQTEALEPFPQSIVTDKGIIPALAKVLHSSGVKHMEKESLRNVAVVMVHFYNKGDGSYPELRKVTKLSQGGVSKFMTSIRRRGLIKRYAYKKFELTPHGLNLLKDAYSKTQNV